MTDSTETKAKIERLAAEIHHVVPSSVPCCQKNCPINALRDEALRLAEGNRCLHVSLNEKVQENKRLAAEVERLERMRPCSPGLTHRNDCEAASDEPTE